MRIILDANEYIFGLNDQSGAIGPLRLVSALPFFIDKVESFALYVPEIIRNKVHRNLAPDLLGEFYHLLESSDRIVYGSLFDVPSTLQAKYRDLGIKEADATIAAFAGHVGADFLISENRHFLQSQEVDAFLICDAETFVRNLESGEVWRLLEKRRAE